MKKLVPLLLFAAFLTGCDRYDSKAKEAAQKTAGQEGSKGEAVKSPVLDFSKYDGPPSLKPVKPTPKQQRVKPSPPSKEPSGFKKSPVLDFSKY